MESRVHLGTRRRDEKDVKIQLKIENRGKGVGVTGNGNQHHRERSLPGNLIEIGENGNVWGTSEKVEVRLMKMEKRDFKQMSQFMFFFLCSYTFFSPSAMFSYILPP